MPTPSAFHAESIDITFDPATISYRKILEFFFQIHDPTIRNRQGNDVGTSYRSAIFYTSAGGGWNFGWRSLRGSQPC